MRIAVTTSGSGSRASAGRVPAWEATVPFTNVPNLTSPEFAQAHAELARAFIEHKRPSGLSPFTRPTRRSSITSMTSWR
jgi:hypothetical protein